MRSGPNSLGNDKGIALIAALGIALMLTLLALALAYRSGLFAASSRALIVKSQDMYATEAGLHEMRYFLWDSSCVPPHWLCLAGITDTASPGSEQYNRYIDYTPLLHGLFTRQLSFTVAGRSVTFMNGFNAGGDPVRSIVFGLAASPSAEIDLYHYQVFARMVSLDNPKTINVLATSERPAQHGRTTVEAAIIYEDPEDYKQKNQSSKKSGSSIDELDTGGSAVPQVRTDS